MHQQTEHQTADEGDEGVDDILLLLRVDVDGDHVLPFQAVVVQQMLVRAENQRAVIVLRSG